MKILVVDDSYEVRDGLRSILRGQAGIELVDEASDGTEAMRKLQRTRFDAVLLDVQTEERGWIELALQVKQRWPETKLLLLLVHRVRLQDVKASGADDCLLKDSPRKEIVHVVNRLLRGDV